MRTLNLSESFLKKSVVCNCACKLLGAGLFAVVADIHAFGVVDDHGEIGFLRQHRRNIQNRAQENEAQNDERDCAQHNKTGRPLLARDIAVEVDGAYRRRSP